MLAACECNIELTCVLNLTIAWSHINIIYTSWKLKWNGICKIRYIAFETDHDRLGVALILQMYTKFGN